MLKTAPAGRAAALALLISLFAAVAPAQQSQPAPAADPRSAEVDKLFAEWDRADSPGYAVAVVRDGRLVHARGYGTADLEHDVRLSPRSVFDIGSTSKQFTAACVLILARQGKLSLDDEVRKHIPEMRRYEWPVTVRQLLNHTGGVRDYLTLMALAGMSPRNDYSDRQVTSLIARQTALNFRPGDEHLYSNSGYYLLGEIVRRASGKSLRQFADENVFRPLGMKETHFHDDTAEIVRNRAVGYARRPAGGFRIDMSIFHVVGDGAVNTTVEDLALWDAVFYDPSKLAGGAELVRDLQATGRLNNGEPLTYANGLVVGEYKGLRRVSHGGAWAGYRADMVRFPDQKLTVICLANFAGADPTAMAHKVADLYLAGQLKTEAPAAGQGDGAAPAAADAKFVELPADELSKRVGSYYDRRGGTFRKVVLEGGKLFYVRSATSRSELAPLSAERFRMLGVPGAVELTFKPADAAGPARVEFVADGRPIVLERVEPFAPTPEQLAAYAGDYYSEELDVTHRLRARDGRLYVSVGDDPEEIPVEPMVTDEFNARGVVLRFRRDAQKRVDGLALDAGRVKGVVFVRR